jgi:iron complex transport system substrate-binding protein
VPDRAKVLADYARRALADARAFVAALPPGESLTVYYAEGMRGLNTDSQGSAHTELIDFIGLANVASGPATSGFGRISVSLDQVIAWRPQVLLVAPERRDPNGSGIPEWLGDPGWQPVPAVASGRIYLIPGAPFNWFDRPPSAARLLGVKWLQWVLWPERVPFDMVRETQEFYRLFFHYELSAEEARAMLDASRPTLAAPTT